CPDVASRRCHSSSPSRIYSNDMAMSPSVRGAYIPMHIRFRTPLRLCMFVHPMHSRSYAHIAGCPYVHCSRLLWSSTSSIRHRVDVGTLVSQCHLLSMPFHNPTM